MGQTKSLFLLAYSSKTSIISCERPTENVGISTLPPRWQVAIERSTSLLSASKRLGCTSFLPPYVESMKNVSTRGKLEFAWSKRRGEAGFFFPPKTNLWGPPP